MDINKSIYPHSIHQVDYILHHFKATLKTPHVQSTFSWVDALISRVIEKIYLFRSYKR